MTISATVIAGHTRMRVIDQRDPIGAERLAGKASALAAILGLPESEIYTPRSISGRCLRNDADAELRIADLARIAGRMLAEHAWAGRAENVRGELGGTIRPYPVAIVVSNYGAGIACARQSDRTRWFRDAIKAEAR